MPRVAHGSAQLHLRAANGEILSCPERVVRAGLAVAAPVRWCCRSARHGRPAQAAEGRHTPQRPREASLLEFERATGGSAAVREARRSGEEYLLERGLFRRKR